MSRPRSGRGANAGGAGARPATQRGVYVQTPKSDIYVALLGVALGAMILGSLLLVLVLNRYGFSTKVSATAPGTLPSLVLLAPDDGTAGISGKFGTVRL